MNKTWIDSMGDDDQFPCVSCGKLHDMDDLARVKMGKDSKLMCQLCIDEKERKERERREQARKKRESITSTGIDQRQSQASQATVTDIAGKIDKLLNEVVKKSDIDSIVARIVNSISVTSSNERHDGDDDGAGGGGDSDDDTYLCTRSVMRLYITRSTSGMIESFNDGKVWGASRMADAKRIMLNLWMEGVLLMNKRWRFVINPELTADQLSWLMGKEINNHVRDGLVNRSIDRMHAMKNGYEFHVYKNISDDRKDHYEQNYRDGDITAEIKGLLTNYSRG